MNLLKNSLASLVIKDMHIKTTMGYYFPAKHKDKEVIHVSLRAIEGEVKQVALFGVKLGTHFLEGNRQKRVSKTFMFKNVHHTVVYSKEKTETTK